jgi:formylglycine-generating enzyme required for sulfatase activity
LKLTSLITGLAAMTLSCLLLEACKPSGKPSESTQPTRKAMNVNPKDGLTYVWIEPGTFTMGCSPGDVECLDVEKPAHQVTITKGFWIGQTEVTQAAYGRVIGTNPSYFKGPSLPVEMITWEEARAYCAASGMRLPTEAEWEYAARGGNSSARYGTVDSVAWHSDNSGEKTHEVGQKAANEYGLYDVLGNVFEWVGDLNGNYGSSPVNDPTGPSSGSYRLLRGGSFGLPSNLARLSFRSGNGSWVRNNNFGVRCAGNDIPRK